MPGRRAEGAADTEERSAPGIAVCLVVGFAVRSAPNIVALPVAGIAAYSAVGTASRFRPCLLRSIP